MATDINIQAIQEERARKQRAQAEHVDQLIGVLACHLGVSYDRLASTLVEFERYRYGKTLPTCPHGKHTA